MTPTTEEPIAQFDIDAREIMRGFVKFAVAVGAAAEAANAIVWIIGLDAFDNFVALGLFLGIFPIAFAWGMWRFSRGTAVLNSVSLNVITRGGVRRYRWRDISELRLKTVASSDASFRIWARMIGVPTDRQLIEIRLKRSIKLALLPGKVDAGTDTFGIPSLFVRMTRLFVVDPEGFLRAADPLMVESAARPI